MAVWERGEPATLSPPGQSRFLEEPATREALECVAESGFSRAELDAYDRYWDSIRCEVTLVDGSFNKGLREGKLERKLEMAAALKKAGLLSDEQIAAASGLAVEQVLAL